MNDLKTRLSHAMEVRRYKSKALSLEAGLNETAIRDILKGRSKNPRTDTTRKISHILQIRHEWLVDGFGDMNQEDHPSLTSSAREEKVGFIPQNTQKIPLHLLKEDGNHYYTLETAQEETTAPPWLEAVQNAFACYCPDNELTPRMTRGDILFIHPNKPVTEYRDVFITLANQKVLIACLQKISSTHITLSFYKNRDDIILDKSEIASLNEIVAIYYR